MNWNKYYQTPLTLEGLFSNLHGQKEFLSEIFNSGGKRLLEVGTGSGAMSIFLSWLGLDITGIDLDPQVIAKAKVESARFNGKADFMVADTFHLPFPDNSFDVIFHQGLLEHFSDDDIRRILAEQLRCAPTVIVSVPNHWYPKKDYGNERLMNQAQWEAILAPFKVEKSYYYSLKRFPRPWLWRKPIQYLAVITRKG
ncbi:MAG: class I SAM-dependent methyltransferase [Patescibacteria group bacterium]